MTAMLASDLPLPRIGRGKVRDIYAVGDDRVLLLTTDRISAFDVVMAETIPMKGAVLTQISAWWFRQLEGVVPHHMISADADEIIRAGARAEGPSRRHCGARDAVPAHHGIPDRMRDPRLHLGLGLEGICRSRARWPAKSCAPGLVESAKLEPAIFSPATKAETGHDENITVARVREIVGDEVADTLESMARAVYAFGEKISRERGIIIADTKFEFGRDKRRPHHPDRRGDDAGQFAVLGGRCLQARPAAAEFRQAAVARLSRRRAPRRPLERRRAASAAAGERGGSHQQALSRGLSSRHRRTELSSRLPKIDDAIVSNAKLPHRKNARGSET